MQLIFWGKWKELSLTFLPSILIPNVHISSKCLLASFLNIQGTELLKFPLKGSLAECKFFGFDPPETAHEYSWSQCKFCVLRAYEIRLTCSRLKWNKHDTFGIKLSYYHSTKKWESKNGGVWGKDAPFRFFLVSW